MSAADMAMVRIVEPGGINLGIGEPHFMQDALRWYYPSHFEGSLTYPPLGGDPELIDTLKKLQGYKHVVITTGGKQALYAAVYALQWQRGRHNGPQFRRLYHPAPYWPTYPTVAALSHLTFKADDLVGDDRRMRVISSPNNPDGEIFNDPAMKWDIWDGVYATPVYGWPKQTPTGRIWAPTHKIGVFSGAKFFGPSSYRIGWLGTQDEELANLAAQYVEKTTSGVAGPSQDFFKQLLRNLDSVQLHESDMLIGKLRTTLLLTNEHFMRLEKHFAEIKGFPVNQQGMFAWVRAKDPERFRALLDKAKVRVVGGQFCGWTDDWFRISLGVLPEVMLTAVKAIEEAEHGSSQ